MSKWLAPAPERTKRRRVPVGFGVDIGGSGIKFGRVDLSTGRLIGDRVREATPEPATPEAIGTFLGDTLGRLEGGLPKRIGVTFPAVIQAGVARTAANVDASWIGTDVAELLTDKVGRKVHVVNDADAAGVAEVRYGAAHKVPGLVFMATLGTGIGTALLQDGRLIPNTELGHIELDGQDAELLAAARVRQEQGLDWATWADSLNRYLLQIERLLWPDLIILGGGVSRQSGNFLPLLRLRTPIVPAALRNNAGIIGAAALAAG
jgi:polyphosphate glucokinase